MKKLFLLLLVVITAASCTQLRHSNFNHQKFTRLKPIESSQNVSTSNVSEINKEEASELTYENYSTDDSTGCDSIWLSNGEVYVCKILEEKKEQVIFTRCPPDSSEFKMDKMHIQSIKYQQKITEQNLSDKSPEIDPEKDKFPNDKTESLNSESSKKDRNSNASKWNRVFHIALVIFLLGLGLLYLSLIIGFTPFVGIGLLVLAWFFSIYLCATSSRHSRNFNKKEVNGYGVKITLSVLYAFAPLIFFVACAALLLILIASF